MKRIICLAAVGVSLLVPGVDVQTSQRSTAGDPHAYFKALVSNEAHWKSYSLRDPQQLEDYKHCRRCPAAVTYDLANDTYVNRQDAAKVAIPPFDDRTTLRMPIDASVREIALETAGSEYVSGRQIQIGAEIMTVRSRSGHVVTVDRGTFDTATAAHSTGAIVGISRNSLQNQVWLPMGTEDGHRYLTTWDVWYGSELRPRLSGLATWKTFQFRRTGKSPAIWFEVRTRFDKAPGANDVATVDARGYSSFGPNVTRDQPLSPQTGDFTLRPETWTRYWMLLEQRADDWDLVSLWVADETRDATRIIDRAQLQAPSVHSFQLEFSTSQDRLSVRRGPLVTYVRNVAILRDPEKPEDLLLRPVAGPAPPRLSSTRSSEAFHTVDPTGFTGGTP